MADRSSLLREVDCTFRLVTNSVSQLSQSLTPAGLPPGASRSRGVVANGDWLSQCLDHVLCRYPASASTVVGVSEKAFQIFLCSDLYLSKGLDPVLPSNLLQRHKEVILRDQVVVLQVS